MKPHYHFELNPEKYKDYRLVIVSIDLEWAKNWKAVTKMVPFCFASHIIYLPSKSHNIIECINSLKMVADVFFRGFNETITEFLQRIDKFIETQLIHKNTVVVGHQINSDLYCMIQNSLENLPCIKKIIERFKERRKKNKVIDDFNVFDTRYDIQNKVKGKERLRDVSLRLKVYAIQFEISNSLSLTKLYNLYMKDRDPEKMEKLIILNWRHAFQTALVYLVDQICPSLKCYSSSCKKSYLTTNNIIYKMAHGYIKYVKSGDYLYSMSPKGIKKYLELYFK
jgi:hypothetical protein